MDSKIRTLFTEYRKSYPEDEVRKILNQVEKVENHRREKPKYSQPIKDKRDIYKLRNILRDKPRDLLLFDLATQTGLRLKYIAKLKVSDLIPYQIGERIVLHSSNGGTRHAVLMTERLFHSFHDFVTASNLGPDEYLFKSRKGNGPLTNTSVSRLVQNWFSEASLEGLSGWSSLRRTWKLHYSKQAPLFVTKNVKQNFEPVRKRTIQETVYRKLLYALISGRLPPGQRIVTDQVANELKVSETPVREALARLQTRGLIWRDDHIGYVVQQLSPNDLEEIIKIRVKLETMAITEACRLISDNEILDLYETVNAFNNRSEYDVDEFYRFNQRFHSTVYKAAQMPTLLGIIENLWEKMSPYFHLLYKEIEEADPRVGWDKHILIIEGLKRRDSEYACHYLKADITGYAFLIIKKMREKAEKSRVTF